MDDVGWYYPLWGHKAHAFRGADARISVCGMSKQRNVRAGRSHRCRSCTRILGGL